LSTVVNDHLEQINDDDDDDDENYIILFITTTALSWSFGAYYNTHCVSKNCANLFLLELRQISSNFDNFWQKDGKEAKILPGCTHFPPHPICVITLPC